QDDKLFRPRPPPQRQPQLRGDRAAQGRQGRHHQAAGIVRARQDAGIAETSMAPSKPGPTAIASFTDHDVIMPPNPFDGAFAYTPDGDDPVARAEAALAGLATEFSGWMNDECDQLDRARREARAVAMAAPQRDVLFRAAHDIRGQAATLGFPLVAAVAESLSRLIEEARDPRRIPFALIDQHVDAVRAIIREHGQARAEVIATQLTRSLREVSDDFLRREGKDGGVLNGVPSPSIVPKA